MMTRVVQLHQFPHNGEFSSGIGAAASLENWNTGYAVQGSGP